MNETVSGPALDRRTLLASGAALAVGLAGCNEDGGGDRGEPGDPVEYVPAGASTVVHADMALTESEETRTLLDAYAGDENQDLLATVEAETGVDPAELNEVVTFTDEPRPEQGTVVVDGDFDESEARSAAEERRGVEYEAADHETGTVYRPTGGDGDEPWVGTAAEGQYVVGPEEDVRTALDVFAGEADGLEGQLREAFDGAREDDGEGEQYVTAATDQPRAYLPSDDSEQVPPGALDVYEDLETATATYTVVDGEVAIEIAMQAPDEDTAANVEDVTGTILMFLRSDADGDAAAELQEVSVERDGSEVTVDYRSDPEGAATLAAWLSQMVEQ